MNTDLPVHPRTGLRAVGIVGGRPVWPIFGAEDNPPAPPAGDPQAQEPPKPGPPPGQPTPAPTQPPAGDPPKEPGEDRPLGPNGEKALRAERKRADDMEARLKALEPLQKLAEALGATGDPGAGKSEIEQITERLANHEKQLAEANTARWRAEVANAVGFTAEQAALLQGNSFEELKAHAEQLKTLFPTAPATPGTPRPDPSQGGQGGTPPDLDAQIAEATKKGDIKAVLRLQNQKLANAKL
ncbi:hypothetical protein [Amycolatopsis echigonensis]|uniref:Uncharacterized protein n=1 Tax=Amycolatopsis echigonensis TaxID=2576905 RepID=A0A8E1W609_9PSEU|nr:hypothetical protein [Amycolatopsis echigonensis]MBB2504312.1 hypothetical protein [Amycolatopsis echigonensis]